MFSWSADTVRFMADACRRTDFHEKLTALLLPYLKHTDHDLLRTNYRMMQNYSRLNITYQIA